MFQHAYMYASAKEGLIPDVYVQNEEYFEAYKDEIRALYRQGVGEPIDMVAIHVRRGDYVGNPYYVDLMDTEYYEDAMDLFPGEKFLVFSDDIEWCKQQEIFKDCEFIHGTELTDMNDMASCSGQIIANSSFSWWAAWITPYSKRIIAPSIKNWYTDGIERTICPPEWIRLWLS